jgi:single-stranded-DNA-specific exonuclease
MPADRRRRRAPPSWPTLDGINRERREIEGGMRDQAMLMAESAV